MAEPYPSNQANSQKEGHTTSDLLTQIQEQDALAFGVDIKQVNPTISYVMEKVFAKPLKGQEFLGLLLTQAEVRQETLTDSTTQTPTAFAVIALQNIRELASRIHWGYDTTHKYVVTLCALNLLLKRRSNNHIELLFPLQHYDPPSSLAELDRLLTKSRPKVQQFARRVRERCILYNIIAPPSSTTLVSTMASPSPEQELIGQLHSILRSENIEAERRQRLVMRISSEIVSKLLVYPAAQVSPQQNQGRLTTSTSQTSSAVVESTLSGRLLPHSKLVCSSKSTPSVDFELQTNVTEEESTSPVDSSSLQTDNDEGESTLTVDSSSAQASNSEEKSTVRVDSSSAASNNNERESTLTVDSGTLEPVNGHEKSTGEGRLFDPGSTPNIGKSTTQKRVDFMPQSAFQAKRPYKKATSLNDLINRSCLHKQVVDSSKASEQKSTPEPEVSLAESTPEQMVDSLPMVVDSKLDTRVDSVDSFSTTVDSQTNQLTEQESLLPTVDFTDTAARETMSEPEINLEKSTNLLLETVDFEHNKVITLLKDPSAYSREFLALYVTLNVNEFITIIYKNNNNKDVTLRKNLQMLLAEIFEGNRALWTNHNILLQTVDAHALASGFVYTLLCLMTPGGQKIISPAAFFTNRCKSFMDGKPNDRQDQTDLLLQMSCEQMFAYLANPNVKCEGLSPFLSKLREEAKVDTGVTRVRKGGRGSYRKKSFSSASIYENMRQAKANEEDQE